MRRQTSAIEPAFAGLSGELSTLNVDQAANYVRSFKRSKLY
jgi:hypothetical protein